MLNNDELNDHELNSNTSDECHPSSGGLDTDVEPHREFVPHPPSVRHDLALEANNRGGAETSSFVSGTKNDQHDPGLPERQLLSRPLSTPREAFAGTVNLDHLEPISPKPPPDTNDARQSQSPRAFALAADGNMREDDPTSSSLSPRKMRVAVALAVGETETNAAQLAGVHRTTVYRWLQDAAFVAEVNRQKREFVAEQRARLHTLLHLATTTVESFLERKDGDALKLKAATFILERFAPQLHEAIGPITEQEVEKVWKKGLG